MQAAAAALFAVAALVVAAPPSKRSTTTTPPTPAKAAAPAVVAPAAKDPAIVLQLEVVDGVIDANERVRVEDELAMMLSRHKRLEAVTQREVKRMVDLEAARQASGCDDEGCAAEIGAALGARWLLGGRVEREANGRMAFSLWLFDAQLAKVVKRAQAKGARYSDVKVQLPFTLDAVIADLKTPGDPAPGDLIEEARPKLAILPPRLPHLGEKSMAAITNAIDEASAVAAQRLNLVLLDGAAVDEIARSAHCKSDDARCTLPAAAAQGAALGLGVSATAVLARATFLSPDGIVVAVGERDIKKPADIPDAVRGAIYDAAARRLGIDPGTAAPSSPAAAPVTSSSDEHLVLQTPCNLPRGIEVRSATCTITTKRLRIDAGGQVDELLISDIATITPVPVLTFVPTGVRVTKNNGETFLLIVGDRDRFIRKLSDPS